MDRYFLAIDIGASSGRHIWGYIRDHRVCLEDESAGMPGSLTEEIKALTGYNCRIVLPPSHDIASVILAILLADLDICYISSRNWLLMGTLKKTADCSKEKFSKCDKLEFAALLHPNYFSNCVCRSDCQFAANVCASRL